MNLPFKVCPECGAEHVHTALVCADCNVALEIASETAPPPPTAPLPPASELVRVAAGSAWEMERLALLLQEAGISSRVDAFLPSSQAAPGRSSRSAPRLALYVPPAEMEPAGRLIRDALLEDGVSVEDRGSGASEPREGASLESCPACGTPIPADASACPDCGLEFVPVEDLCPSCGAVLPAEATACASCGAEPSREGR